MHLQPHLDAAPNSVCLVTFAISRAGATPAFFVGS